MSTSMAPSLSPKSMPDGIRIESYGDMRRLMSKDCRWASLPDYIPHLRGLTPKAIGMTRGLLVDYRSLIATNPRALSCVALLRGRRRQFVVIRVAGIRACLSCDFHACAAIPSLAVQDLTSVAGTILVIRTPLWGGFVHRQMYTCDAFVLRVPDPCQAQSRPPPSALSMIKSVCSPEPWRIQQAVQSYTHG